MATTRDLETLSVVTSTSPETATLELASNDPRDYFRFTKLQKIGAELWPAHDWTHLKALDTNTCFSGKEGQIIIGNTNSPEAHIEGLIYCSRNAQGETYVYTDQTREHQRRNEFAAEFISTYAKYLPAQQRIQVTNSLLEYLKENPEDSLTTTCNRFTNNYLDTLLANNPNTQKAEHPLTSKILQAIPDSVEKANIATMIAKCSELMTPDAFEAKLTALVDDLNRTEGIFEGTFNKTFLDWVVKDELKYRLNFPDSIEPEVAKYNPHDLVTQNFGADTELQQIMGNMSYEDFPAGSITGTKPDAAEFVDSQDVCGFLGENDTAATDSKGWAMKPEDFARVKSRISDVKADRYIHSENNQDTTQIILVKLNGKYWIENGRHRMAALKALGIHKIPVIVREVTNFTPAN